jgi:NADH-quinone oxidoreductase subunit L
MIFFASRKFVDYKESEKEESAISKFLANKWYVDELYEAVIVKPLDRFASFLGSFVDNKIIDGLVNGVGKAVQFSGRQMRLLQSGQVGSYILIMMISIIIFFIFQLFWK